jgi:hypothetical protein
MRIGKATKQFFALKTNKAKGIALRLIAEATASCEIRLHFFGVFDCVNKLDRLFRIVRHLD